MSTLGSVTVSLKDYKRMTLNGHCLFIFRYWNALDCVLLCCSKGSTYDIYFSLHAPEPLSRFSCLTVMGESLSLFFWVCVPSLWTCSSPPPDVTSCMPLWSGDEGRCAPPGSSSCLRLPAGWLSQQGTSTSSFCASSSCWFSCPVSSARPSLQGSTQHSDDMTSCCCRSLAMTRNMPTWEDRWSL